MNYQIRRSQERKYFDHGWLKTYHTFSFGSYFDPAFMGFRDLRVINEDRVAPGHGFPPHSHQDMEIISLVLEGKLAHQDSMGNKSTILSNSLQSMSAGTGVTHSEFNPGDELVHFYQIWIMPNKKGLQPSYQETPLPPSTNAWTLIASINGKEGSLKIAQDVEVFALNLEKDKHNQKELGPERFGWLQVINGELVMDQEHLYTGDGVAFNPASVINLKAIQPSRLLFFDLK